MDFHLVLRGTGYRGGAAGMGGDEIPASIKPVGDLNEAILYIDKTMGVGFIKSVIERLNDTRSDVKVAYISSGSLKFIDEFGVVLCDTLKHKQQVQKIGPGVYALYRIQ